MAVMTDAWIKAGLDDDQFERMLLDAPEDHPNHPEPPLWMYDRTCDGNVVKLTRPKIKNVGAATVIGDLAAPECEALLNTTAVVGTTTHAPRVMGDRWIRFEGTWDDVVKLMGNHPERADKGGSAMFFAASDLTGKRTQDGWRYMYKLKAKLRTVYAVAIDVDGGCAVAPVVARLRGMGLFAVVYSTFSHTIKGGPGKARFRVILPLEEPFELGRREDNPEAWEARYAEWQSRYIGLCEHLIPGEIDAKGRLPSQLMYMPARPEGAEYEHYILAGRGVTLDDMPAGDVSKYTRQGPSGVKRGGVSDAGEPAFLSDGFDLLAWAQDHGQNFFLPDFLEMVGWDVRGDAGRGVDILCPNAAAHTSGDDAAWAAEGEGSDSSGIIYCHHAHCDHLYTCDFLRLIEEQTDLPDGHSFSALLCDPIFYPSEMDGEVVTVNRGDYVEEEIRIGWHKTPTAVKRAFKALPANAGEDHFAAIYAGIVKAGLRSDAAAKWAELIKTYLDANGRKHAERRGREMRDAEKKASAAEKAEERQANHTEALANGVPANVSLDPAEPLGDDMETALATLGHRFAPCDLGGQFRIVRKPDLNAFNSDFDSTIAVYRKEDFLNLHLDRQIGDGEKLVNPAQTFLETAKRKSGLVFAPPPAMPGENDFNMYQGRKLGRRTGVHGDRRDFPTLHEFMLETVCDGDSDKLKWLTLWMAHMVQRPGEKPGTAVIGVGEGGIGKGRFGALLAKLTLPHFKQLENEKHVLGQFAGEHISKCVLVQVNEAVFGADPKIASTLKAQIDSVSIPVEAKGLSIVTVPSYTRYYFDSNEAVPVLIENNGSERRYFVLRFNPDRKGETEYFEELTAAIEGEEMAMLLGYLERWQPASAGMSWADVRTAPETPERRVMAWHSMRPAVRRLLTVLRDREAALWVDGLEETFSADAGGLRVPVSAFRTFIAAAGNKHNAEDSDVEGMIKRLFGVEIETKRGRCGGHKDVRFWQFPPEVLGGEVDKAFMGG